MSALHPVDVAAALQLFRRLPISERWFVRARLFSAPLEALAARVPRGRVVDVGCGHGLLSALVAAGRGDVEVTGVDVDAAKVHLAQLCVGALSRTRFLHCELETLVEAEPESFDAAVIADVLYLLPQARWPSFLGQVRRLLRPGGRLLLKEAEADGSWKALKCLAQEHLMVRVLRRTAGSGGLGFVSRARMEDALREAGFELQRVLSLGRGYTTPHVLFEARMPA